MKETVYLDSTIPSYYFDQRKSLESFIEITRKWWSEMASYYELYVSDAVLQELNSGEYPNKSDIIELVSTIPLLPLTSYLEQIVEFYIANYVMPKSLIGDAVHLAYASYYNIQWWSCKK